jgi:hypothetical protein
MAIAVSGPVARSSTDDPHPACGSRCSDVTDFVIGESALSDHTIGNAMDYHQRNVGIQSFHW